MKPLGMKKANTDKILFTEYGGTSIIMYESRWKIFSALTLRDLQQLLYNSEQVAHICLFLV